MNNFHPESQYIKEGGIKAKIFGSPLKVDASGGSTIYLGYASLNQELQSSKTWLIQKTVITGDFVNSYFAYGEWSDRATLTYVEEV